MLTGTGFGDFKWHAFGSTPDRQEKDRPAAAAQEPL
jgi:hypothetical protein